MHREDNIAQEMWFLLRLVILTKLYVILNIWPLNCWYHPRIKQWLTVRKSDTMWHFTQADSTNDLWHLSVSEVSVFCGERNISSSHRWLWTPRRFYRRTFIDGSILLFLHCSQEQLCGLRGGDSCQSFQQHCKFHWQHTLQYTKEWISTRRNHCTTHFLLPSNVLGPSQPFCSQQSLTGSTCSGARLEFGHPLGSERVELQLQFNSNITKWQKKFLSVQGFSAMFLQ